MRNKKQEHARRDVDAFSFEFAQTPAQPASPVTFQLPTLIYIY